MNHKNRSNTCLCFIGNNNFTTLVTIFQVSSDFEADVSLFIENQEELSYVNTKSFFCLIYEALIVVHLYKKIHKQIIHNFTMVSVTKCVFVI